MSLLPDVVFCRNASRCLNLSFYFGSLSLVTNISYLLIYLLYLFTVVYDAVACASQNDLTLTRDLKLYLLRVFRVSATDIMRRLCAGMRLLYTVDRKKRGSTFVIITLEEHTRFV